MILFFIIGISLIQFGLYYLNKKRGPITPDFVILFAFLICHGFLFPKLFYPELSPDGINCGMPILGITLAFWVFGGIAVIVTHIIWKIIRHKSTKAQQRV